MVKLNGCFLQLRAIGNRAALAIINLRKCRPSTGGGDGESDRDHAIAAQDFAANHRPKRLGDDVGRKLIFEKC